MSESDAAEHFRCKLMSWPPLGHSNTILYALFIVHSTSFSHCAPRLNRGNLLPVLTPEGSVWKSMLRGNPSGSQLLMGSLDSATIYCDSFLWVPNCSRP